MQYLVFVKNTWQLVSLRPIITFPSTVSTLKYLQVSWIPFVPEFVGSECQSYLPQSCKYLKVDVVTLNTHMIGGTQRNQHIEYLDVPVSTLGTFGGGIGGTYISQLPEYLEVTVKVLDTSATPTMESGTYLPQHCEYSVKLNCYVTVSTFDTFVTSTFEGTLALHGKSFLSQQCLYLEDPFSTIDTLMVEGTE